MNKRHKHADLIIAWANGATIQFYSESKGWTDTLDNNPKWCKDIGYRIKPEEDPFKELKIAREQGKTIQHLNHGSWEDIDDRGFVWVEGETYRVKPKKILVPFRWEDREQLRNKYIVPKTGPHREYLILGITAKMLHFEGLNYISYQELLDKFTFANGDPCGKYVEL